MRDEEELDLLFGASRAMAPVPSADLMARVLTDAYAQQPEPAQRPVRAAPALPGWRRALSDLAAAMGGGGVLAGLGSAAVAGLFIGYANPPSADWLSNSLLPAAADSVDLLSAGDLFVTEG